MRPIVIIISLLAFSVSSTLFASDDVLTYDHVATVDLLLDRAITNNLIAGGVVVIGNHTGIISSTARGRLNSNPQAPLLDDQTIFDLASLTKVIATAPAVMKLLDEGRISLKDPLTKWFPEFKGSDSRNITILNLLTHTSGFTDFDLAKVEGMSSAIRKAAMENNRRRAGVGFNYADINFILLGELVHRASGMTLDEYCRKEIYTPLVTHETMFLPASYLTGRIAPTAGTESGIVQDKNSRKLGSVAGHAGLFSSAQDLARFARMMLNGGEVDGIRVLSEQAVAQMISPYACGSGKVMRGLGWDRQSPYSAANGRLFSEASFGHTGYSGSSIWIDPKQDLFVILLTNRTNYSDIKGFNQLRGDVATIAAAELQQPGDHQLLASTNTVMRVSANLQPPTPHRRSRGAAHNIRLIAFASEAHSSSHRPSGKKNGKARQRKSHGSTQRA